jgi:hypothetical protein
VGPEQRLRPITNEIKKLDLRMDRRKAAVGLGVLGALGALTLGLFRLMGKSSRG